MGGFLSTITDIFSSLFSGNSDEAKKKKALKETVAELKQQKPPLYRPGSKAGGEVLPSFGTSLYNFYNILYPIREILEKTVNSPDSKIAAHYRDYLIENSLPGDVTGLRLSISLETMKERVQKSSAPSREMKYINDHLRDGMKQITKQDEELANLQMNHFNRLSELCRLDYETTLKAMDPRINLTSKKYKPTFNAVPGTKVLPLIMDIYFVLAPFNLETGIENNLHLLIEKLFSERVKERQKAVSKNLNLMKRLLQRHLAPLTLLNLIRAVKGDPFFQPPVDQEENADHAGAFRERLEKDFQKNRDKLEREMNEGVIGTNLKALFPDGKMESVRGYNQENSRIFRDEADTELIHVRPYTILKTFSIKKFDQNLAEPLNQVIIAGFFDDKAFQTRINEVYHKCGETSSRLSQFESGLTDEPGSSIKTALTYLEGIENGKDLSASLSQVLDTINSRVGEVIEEETNLYYALGNQILDIINDYKSRSPEKISNIKTIGGNGNRELMSQIVKGYNDLAKFIKVMKNFTMIRTAAPSAPDKDST